MKIEECIVYCINNAGDKHFFKGHQYIIRNYNNIYKYNNEDVYMMEICDIQGNHIAQFDRRVQHNIDYISLYFVTLKEYRKQKLEKINSK